MITPASRWRRIGVDLDNTLACYDDAFSRLARDRGLDVPATAGKAALREALCAQGRESVWTELQGEAYGRHMGMARPYPGAVEFLHACAAAGIECVIVSHRSRTPLSGASFDLHAAAHAWLCEHRILDSITGGVRGVFLETSRAAKLARLEGLALDVFLDDLSEILLDRRFPPNTQAVHFAPPPQRCAHPGLVCVASWDELHHAGARWR